MATYVLVTGSPSFRGMTTFIQTMDRYIERIKAKYNDDKIILLSYGEGRIPAYVQRYANYNGIGTIIGNQEEGILMYHKLKEAKNWVNILFDMEPMFPTKQILSAPTFKFRSQKVGG